MKRPISPPVGFRLSIQYPDLARTIRSRDIRNVTLCGEDSSLLTLTISRTKPKKAHV